MWVVMMVLGCCGAHATATAAGSSDGGRLPSNTIGNVNACAVQRLQETTDTNVGGGRKRFHLEEDFRSESSGDKGKDLLESTSWHGMGMFRERGRTLERPEQSQRNAVSSKEAVIISHLKS